MINVARRVAALLDHNTNKEARYYTDYEELKEVLDELRAVGKKVVLTQGVYDLLHVGHAQYLEKARSFGDVLVVGVDSDALTRKRKGDGRPIVPQEERINILLHLRHVDIVVLRDVDQELETLIRTIKPEVYIASESTKDFIVDEELAAYCGAVHTLPPQATTSTTARVRQVSMLGADELAEEFAKQMPDMVREVLKKIKSNGA
jgi:D-beta-D-heptose 7-phosphate kinase/D-beta-D-heptose 1-phosphate adenosyltransferase